MKLTPKTELELKTVFTASCVESVANAMGLPAREVYRRMVQVGLIENYIWKYYDTLHTQSREYVVEDVLETLGIWEKQAEMQEGEGVC